MAGRSFLLLQGVASPFFRVLADALRARGHAVQRVNFCGGDMAYAGRGAHWNFYDPAAELGSWLERRAAAVTDLVLFGDCRPLHRVAMGWARERGLPVHVFEEGYFRPYWATLERSGVNGYSSLPRDARWYRTVGARLPDYGEGAAFASPFWLRAAHDVAYHMAGVMNTFLFPWYRTHAPTTAAVEYAGYLRRFMGMAMWRQADEQAVRTIVGDAVPFYFFPLQLDSDAQIRDHSPFADMAEALHTVMASFARHAPGAARLVIKGHPLDPGLVNYRHQTASLARHYALADRVVYVDAGDLAVLLPRAHGVVTVNSTVGALALALGRPTLALSAPFYKLQGLTFDGPLDAFWGAGAQPDAELFRCFRNTVIHATQINGGFYSGQGITMAVANSVLRLEAERSPLEELS